MAGSLTCLWYILIGFLAGLLLTPLAKVLAPWVGAIDNPGELKVHAKAMPRFGGSAIWAATVLACVGGEAAAPAGGAVGGLLPVLIGATAMALIGALDDITGLSARARLAAGGAITAGTVVAVTGGVAALPWVQALLVAALALWLLGSANALNMLDGLDGLAAGVSAIGALSIGALAWHAGSASGAILMLSLAGACLGFLKYNFRPASTFMGDVGSLFLGFALAASVVLIVSDSPPGSALPTVLGAIVALSVPIGDMLLAMLRRRLNNKPVFDGDRSHFYDQLRDRFGFSVVKTVVTMYAIAGAFGILGFGVSLLTPPQAVIATMLVVAIAVVAVLRGGFLRCDGDAT